MIATQTKLHIFPFCIVPNEVYLPLQLKWFRWFSTF